METNTKIQLKIPKNKIVAVKPNANGYLVGIYVNVGASPFVGYLVIVKELKHCYKGYLGRCTREESKAGCLYTEDLMQHPVKAEEIAREV